MSDPFLTGQTSVVLSQELQRLQQENKKLREENVKLSMQIKYMSSPSSGTSARQGASRASVRSGGSARTTGSRASQLRRVAPVSALASKPFEIRAGHASDAIASPLASSSSPLLGTAPRRPGAARAGGDQSEIADALVHARSSHRRSSDRDSEREEDWDAAGVHVMLRTDDPDQSDTHTPHDHTTARLKRATSSAYHLTQLKEEAEKQRCGAEKEKQHLRSRFESFVTYACEREEGYHAVYNKMYAELKAAQAQCEALEAASRADREALVALQTAQQTQLGARTQETHRGTHVVSSAPVPDSILEVCDALDTLLRETATSTATAAVAVEALTSPLTTLTSFVRSCATSTATGTHASGATSGRSRAGVKRSRAATSRADDEGGDAAEAVRTPRASTTAARTSPRAGRNADAKRATADDTGEDSTHPSDASFSTGPPVLRIVKGGAALRSDAALQLALQKAAAATSRAAAKPRRYPRRDPSTTVAPTTHAMDVEAQFPSGQPQQEAQRVRVKVSLSGEDPIGSFLVAYRRQVGSVDRAALREALMLCAGGDVTHLVAQAVRYLCRAHGHEQIAPRRLTLSELTVLVRHTSEDLEALLGVSGAFMEGIVAGLRDRLMQLLTIPWHGTEERAGQLNALQITATALRRALYMDVQTCRRGVRGPEAIRSAFAAAMDAQLTVVYDLTLVMLRAWRGTEASSDGTDKEEAVAAAEETAAHAERHAMSLADSDEADAGDVSETYLVGPATRWVRLVDRWLCAVEALCTRTPAEAREADDANAPVERLPRRRLTYAIEALVCTCVSAASAQAEALVAAEEDSPAATHPARRRLTTYWRQRWLRLCRHLGWSVRQLPLEALTQTMTSTVSAAVGMGFEATRSLAYTDAIAALRLAIAYHGFPLVQIVKDQLAQALDKDAHSDCITEPFAQCMSYAVLDLRLHDPRDELWASTVHFFIDYLSSVSAARCRSPEEMVASLRPTHVLVARALLQLCEDAEHQPPPPDGDMSDETGVDASHALAKVVQWALEHRAAVAIAQSRQEPSLDAPRRDPLLDTDVGRYVLRVCSGALTSPHTADEDGV